MRGGGVREGWRGEGGEGGLAHVSTLFSQQVCHQLVHWRPPLCGNRTHHIHCHQRQRGGGGREGGRE